MNTVALCTRELESLAEVRVGHVVSCHSALYVLFSQSRTAFASTLLQDLTKCPRSLCLPPHNIDHTVVFEMAVDTGASLIE